MIIPNYINLSYNLIKRNKNNQNFDILRNWIMTLILNIIVNKGNRCEYQRNIYESYDNSFDWQNNI